MKKILIFISLIFVFIVSCGNNKNLENIEIETYNSKKEIIKETVPYNPQRIAVVGFAALDIVDSLGLGDRVVATSKNLKIDYLKDYSNREDILELGIPQKVDLENLSASKPDLIIVGRRALKHYDEIKKIAPTIVVINDNNKTYLENLEFNMDMVAKIFGLEKLAKDLYSPFKNEFSSIKEKFEGKTLIMGLATGGSFNVLGNNSYLSVIPSDFGFVNLAKDIESSHGNEVSFEYILKENPEYIFVLDRDSAIGVNGAKLAKDIMDNDLVKETEAFKNNKIVYLTPVAWYISAGGYNATKVMIEDMNSIK